MSVRANGSSQTWTAPTGTDEKWPDGRGLHSAACLVDPKSDLAERDQRLIVFWGEGIDAKILNDVWILSVSNLSWTQVCTIIEFILFQADYFFHQAKKLHIKN